MSGQEKFDSCRHRPDEQIEIFDGCPCKKIKKLVYKCDKRNIVDLKSVVCEACDLYEQKQLDPLLKTIEHASSGMAKFKYKKEYTEKNFRSEFIISCLQVVPSQHRNIAWAKEMKIMNDLVKKCEDPVFWFHARTDFAIPSLAWFLTEGGRKYLNDKYHKFKLELKNQPRVYEILEEKQGEDQVHIPKKIKTIMDFIKKK